MKLFFFLLLLAILIQALVHASAFSSNANSVTNMNEASVMVGLNKKYHYHKRISGAGRHRERMFVTEHAGRAVRDATAFLRGLTATRVHVLAMLNSEPMAISSTDELFFSPRSSPPSKGNQWSTGNLFGLYGNYANHTEVYHDEDLFQEDYKEMNRSMKIYIYPHDKDDPYANILLPADYDPKGHYASELYFKKVIAGSHFITQNPSEADLFFMPFSIVEMRHDPRIGPEGMRSFIKQYIYNISQTYPYWNRTDGADHFYVACHSIGRFAMDEVFEAKFNVIQVVCSSSYFVAGYVPHKDASMPQIWPRQGNPPDVASLKRKQLAFFAGTINSPARVALLKVWGNDTAIFAHFGRLGTPDDEQLLDAKFCLHVKGFEVNTARVADAIYYGCVPVILANHYDLPFTDTLNWEASRLWFIT
ncbi:Exostosin family protein [Hibiscus syriacus]|uniref:Exostosin family protein n=1 Tax=Hibiscus syriacus TaxID=106335 RepID=A0A6A3B7V2_HIBSY|nr:Exostosin family protein [Hibiscus syriacus]